MKLKPMLAKPYTGQNIKGWLMSEKLDGVRAVWNGSELLSRNGNKFFAPDWFFNQLPAGIILDGELFIGRGCFQQTVSIVRKKKPIDIEWQTIRYCVFDAPEATGGFAARLTFAEDIIKNRKIKIAEVVNHVPCRNEAHLREFSAALCAEGAEGVMLRKSDSCYEQKRSGNLLKFKSESSDEAEVIDYQPGEGKHAGALGALICKWKGIIFNLGTGFTDVIRDNPPQIGSRVTFKFQELTNAGVPRFPVFIAERNYE